MVLVTDGPIIILNIVLIVWHTEGHVRMRLLIPALNAKRRIDIVLFDLLVTLLQLKVLFVLGLPVHVALCFSKRLIYILFLNLLNFNDLTLMINTIALLNEHGNLLDTSLVFIGTILFD